MSLPLGRKTGDAHEMLADLPGLLDGGEGASRLRELLLDLAIRGRLSDAKHAASNTDGPFEVPGGWEWVSFGEVATLDMGKTPDTKNPSYWDVGGVPWVSIGDMPANGIVSSTSRSISKKALGEVFRDRIVPAGTLLMSFKLTIGKVCLLGVDALHNEAIVSIYPGPRVCKSFLMRFLPRLALGGASKNAVMGATLNRASLASLPIPVPPLAEQKRIVAKVDELMRLIDDLEARQTKARDVQTRFRTSALDALTKAEGPEELAEAWTRVAGNFEVLFERAESVGELRSQVLDLAVRGALEGDRPVEPRDPAAPFPIPMGWRWARLGELCERITKGSSPKWQGIQYLDAPTNGILFVTSENVGSGRLLLDTPKYVERRFNEIEPRSILRRGDLLMNIVGASIGRVAIFDRDDIANVNQAVCIIRLLSEDAVLRPFMLMFLNTPTCISYMFDKQVDSARANLSMGNIAGFLIPVPALGEQKRIVAKVDALMKLCDDLEAKLRAKQAAAARLVEAVVRELVA